MQNMPLHAAAAGKHADIVKLLIDHGASVNARQHGGWTALHAAAQNGDVAMAAILIAAGARCLRPAPRTISARWISRSPRASSRWSSFWKRTGRSCRVDESEQIISSCTRRRSHGIWSRFDPRSH